MLLGPLQSTVGATSFASRTLAGCESLLHPGPASPRRLVVSLDRTPKYVISDQASLFHVQYDAWCDVWEAEPRFGAISKHGCIALVERLILTFKLEALHALLVVPLRLDDMQDEIDCFLRWVNLHRPHQSLGGVTPMQRYEGLRPARDGPRFEPRALYSPKSRPSVAAPDARPRSPGRTTRARRLRLRGS